MSVEDQMMKAVSVDAYALKAEEMSFKVSALKVIEVSVDKDRS